MGIAGEFAPLRSQRDIEELERVPLEQRLLSWDANAWIRRGLDLAPDKVAIRYVADGDPSTPSVDMTYGELKQHTTATANLFHSLGVSSGDTVLYLMPTIPALYTVMLGSLAAGVSCCTNWMLEPDHWVGLIRASGAKVVVALGPTPGYEIWEKLQTIRSELPSGVRILSVQMPGGAPLPDTDLEVLASKQPNDKSIFTRDAKPDDIAAYVHSGGTTGSPKLVRLTHRGFSYKFWANTLVMAHTPKDVIFADYPMFHIAGFFGRGIMAIADGMEIVIPAPGGARDKKFIENYWRFVEKFRISLLSGVPTTLAQLSKLPTGGANLSSLRPYGVTGSTAFPAEVARQLAYTLGIDLIRFDMSEYMERHTVSRLIGALGRLEQTFAQSVDTVASLLGGFGGHQHVCAVQALLGNGGGGVQIGLQPKREASGQGSSLREIILDPPSRAAAEAASGVSLAQVLSDGRYRRQAVLGQGRQAPEEKDRQDRQDGDTHGFTPPVRLPAATYGITGGW